MKEKKMNCSESRHVSAAEFIKDLPQYKEEVRNKFINNRKNTEQEKRQWTQDL